MYIYKAGVVGAGQMGSGIAQVISYAGPQVVLMDVDQKQLEKGTETIRWIYNSRVQKGRISQEEMNSKMFQIKTTTKYDDLKDCDIIIEAIFEDLEVKKLLFKDLDKICQPSTIFASNTSSLPISAMAASSRPQNFIGLHFFYPANVMKLVEVIPALTTSQETIDTAISFVERLRKIPIKVKECPGFLVNRLLLPYLYECCYAVEEGLAMPSQIDEKLVAFGMPMGPFVLVDTLGIDICYHVSEVMFDGYGEIAHIPRLVEVMFKGKRLGKKAGVGFYPYNGHKDDFDTFLARLFPTRQPSKEGFDIQRPLLAMLNEACRCLEESIASANDLDLALLAGIGFPQDKAGILHWADESGLDEIYLKLKTLAKRYGQRLWPSTYLKRLVDSNLLGKKTKRGFFEYA